MSFQIIKIGNANYAQYEIPTKRDLCSQLSNEPSIFLKYYEFINHLLPGRESSDADFESALTFVLNKNLSNILLPERYLTGKGRLVSLGPEEKQALLKRVDQIKRDFYHKCMDNIGMLPSELDGNCPTDSLLSFLFDLLNQQVDHPEDQRIQEMVQLFSETYQFAAEREALDLFIEDQDRKARKAAYMQKLKAKLAGMNKGDRFVYEVSACGHSMLMEFKVKGVGENRVIDVELINSGLGVGHHSSKSFLPILNPNAKYQSYCVEGAKLEDFLNSGFIEQLVEQEIPEEAKGCGIPIIDFFIKLFSTLSRNLQGVDKIYKLIEVSVVQNAGGSKVNSHDPRLHHHPQNHGICSRKIYQYWMRENLEVQEFKHYLKETVGYGLERLKAAELLENNIRGSIVKEDSLKDRLFIQPHWVSKGIACLRNRLETRTMVLMGEEFLRKQTIDLIDKQIGNITTGYPLMG